MVLAASALVLFAACKKEEVNKGYTINGDQITFGVGLAAPQDNEKQSYNGQEFRIYFTTNDSMIINGNHCVVIPEVLPQEISTLPGTTTAFSPYARVTTTLSAGAYDFYYPAKIFSTNEAGQYTATFPNDVRCLNMDLENNHFDSIIPTQDEQGHWIMSSGRPVWPMYYHINNLATDGNVVLKNTTAFLTPRIEYGPEFANKVFGPIYNAVYTVENCPAITIWDGYVRTDSKITGPAHLDVTNPSNPTMVMDGQLNQGEYDVLHFDLEDNVGIVNPSQNQSMRMLGMFPIPASSELAERAWQMAVTITANVGGEWYYMIFRTIIGHQESIMLRNWRYNLNLNLQSLNRFAFQDNDGHTYVNYDTDYLTKIANNQLAHIQFKNGDLYITKDIHVLDAWRNQNIWVVQE